MKWKKRVLHIIVAIGIILMLILPVLPVRAASDVIPVTKEQLESGWRRVSPTMTMHVLSTDGKTNTVEYVTSALPETLDDNKTTIDNKWYYQVDPGGQYWYENGSNTFKARVTKDKISVLDKNGRITNFSSALSIEDKTYKGGNPTPIDDPLNGQKKSALAWNYGSYGKGSNLTRYLRSNNGRLSELWILSGDPKVDLIFRPNMIQEKNYQATTTPIYAFDSDYHAVPVTANEARGYYTISASSLANVKYPVYIDPTYDFTWWSDAWIQAYNATYNTAWTATSGNVLINGDFPAWIGQEYTIGTYYIDRSYLIWNTTTLPSSLSITTAAAYLFGYLDESDLDFNLIFCNGQPTYPSSPPVIGDYNKAVYTSDIGSGKYTSTWSTSSYNIVNINNTGFVTKAGFTKLALRSSYDIADSPPIAGYAERVSFWQGEHGSSTQPLLRVIGTVPAVAPTIQTNAASGITTTGATLNGYVADDGGSSVTTQFQYGTSVAYGSTTAWTPGFTTGDTFSTAIAGLSPGTVYHYRAVGTTGAGTGYGSDVTFTTAPMPPTFFSATGGATQNTLNWTKGTGADKTYIRRKTGSYPSSISDGTLVYNNTGTNFVDSPLVNGTTYYYTAWSLAADAVTYSLTTAQTTGTPSALGPPTVVTGVASGVGATDATLQGNLTSLGGYATCDVWFQYGETLAYELGDTTHVPKTVTGTFTDTLSGLDPVTLYHFRAAASNGDPGSPVYGSDATFTTGSPSAPTMTTGAATGVQTTSVQLNGTVTSDGGAPPVTVWFKYGLTTAYELGTTPTAAGLYTGGTFYYGLGSLTPNTTYHYQAVGQNSLGIGYGNDQTFLTATAALATVVTNDATSVGAVQATLQGTLLTDGGSSCTLSFEYGTTLAYGTTVTASPASGTGGTAYNALITGLSTGQLYHFRARAINGGGTAVGADKTFTTVFGAPTNFLATAISSTTINLSWTLQGDQTFINYKTSGYPVDRLDGTQVYFGTSTFASLSGLTPGVSYYFSAWSWKTGDVWTTTNANAIATTFASTGPNVIPTPTVPSGAGPSTPSSWFDVPTNAVIRNFPMYDVLTGWATAYQMPEGTFWALASLLLSTVLGGLAFITFRQAVPAVGASIVVIIICGMVQACPPILAFFIAAIEIGGAYGLMSLGGNIAGRGA